MGAAVAPGADTDNDPVVVERAAGVALAIVPAADIQPAGAQHVISNWPIEISVTFPANGLVHGPNLHVAQLLRKRTTRLQLDILNNLLENVKLHKILCNRKKLRQII
jgi:hypothetical protein